MRSALRASRHRILALAASIAISGSALAAAALPAQAAPAQAPAVANTITLSDPGPQVTNPLSTPVDLPIKAIETNETGTLSFAVTGPPAADGFAFAEPTVPGDATADLTGTFAAPFSGDVTVTVTDDLTPVHTKSVTFTWTAQNTVTVPSPGTQTTQVGGAVSKKITATDTDTAAPLSYGATGLPTGLVINAASGLITGTPTARGTYTATVTATDSSGATASRAFSWDITANSIVVKAKAPAQAWVGVPIKVQATATDSAPGQAAKLTWSATSLPPGLAISKTSGLISGRTTQAITRTAKVTAHDAYGTTGSAAIAFKIVSGVDIVSPGPQQTTVGQWIKINPLTATDRVPGDKPGYSVSGLPAGMGFQASPMLFYGWPARAGVYWVTVHEKGSLGSVGAMKFKLSVKSAPAKSAAGPIRLALDGKCLQDPGGKTASGTRVRIEPCVAGGTQTWTVDSDATIRVNGRCLSVGGTGSYAGRPLELDACGKASPRQLWAQGNHGQLVATASALCVTDPGASRKNGPVPTLGSCRNQPDQHWTLPAQPILTALGGSCADLHYSSGTNGNIIDMFWCNHTMGQNWTLHPDGTIRAGLYSDKCLSIRGKKAVIYTCAAASKNQKWTVVRTGSLSSELTQAGVCLAIPALTTAKGTLLETNGTQLITAKCSRTDPRDLWHIG